MTSKNIFELLPDSDPETENLDDIKPVKTDKKKEKNLPSAQGQAKPKETKAPGFESSKFFLFFV